MKLQIKNMVCDRCVLAIWRVMFELDQQPASVTMGEIDFADRILSDDDVDQIRLAIEPLGFELVSTRKQAFIEQIKTSLIQLVHGGHELENIKLSDHLGRVIKQDYQSLSQLFSSVEGLTIEKYFIRLKVERVKELLVYDELNLTEISYRLGYSSLAHLSSQFKQITGMTPTAFKNLKGNKQRRSLDKLVTHL